MLAQARRRNYARKNDSSLCIETDLWINSVSGSGSEFTGQVDYQQCHHPDHGQPYKA